MITCHTDSLPEFVEHAWAHLEREPVLNNVFLTIVAAMVDGFSPAVGTENLIRATDGSGAVVGAALRTPPREALISDVAEPAALALAGFAAEHLHPLPGVSGRTRCSDWFAGRYQELTGDAAVPRSNSRIYRLDEPPTVARTPSGRARPATADDRDLLIRWADAFAAEAGPHQPPRDNSGAVDARLRRGGLIWIWEDGGEPAAMTWITRPVAGLARINAVYTPPDLRGRGYASGCVAAATRHAQTTLASACMLYADLANPTSNKIYQDLGYRPVDDFREWVFTSGEHAAHPEG